MLRRCNRRGQVGPGGINEIRFSLHDVLSTRRGGPDQAEVIGNGLPGSDRWGRQRIFKDKAQLPALELRRRAGGSGAVVPHFEHPRAISALASESLEAFLRETIAVG